MDQNQTFESLAVKYDPDQDILYWAFHDQDKEAIAEEVGDEVFVRFDPDTRQIVDVECLNLSSRLVEIFGPDMKYSGLERPERLLLPDMAA